MLSAILLFLIPKGGVNQFNNSELNQNKNQNGPKIAAIQQKLTFFCDSDRAHWKNLIHRNKELLCGAGHSND